MSHQAEIWFKIVNQIVRTPTYPLRMNKEGICGGM